MSVIPHGHMKTVDGSPPPEMLTFVERRMTLAANEKIVDLLADLLLDADQLLDMLHADDTRRMHWVERHVQKVYDEVNEVMKRLCD